MESISQFRNQIFGVFRNGGKLSQVLPSYQFRSDQQDMALMVADTLSLPGTVATIEAATGIGKSFAYLLPCLLSGRRVVIATANLYLQDQLLTKDIPLVQSIVPEPATVVSLKGRKNYLCLDRLDHLGEDMLENQTDRYSQIINWSKQTEHGELSELSDIGPIESLGRYSVSFDECKGMHCSRKSDCFVFRQRKRAREAACVVVNHDIFLQDLLLRSRSLDSALLPDADIVIIDEAHHFFDKLTNALSVEFSVPRFTRILEEAKPVFVKSANVLGAIDATMLALDECSARCHSSVAGMQSLTDFIEGLSGRDLFYRVTGALKQLCDISKNVSQNDKMNEHTMMFQAYLDRLCTVIEDTQDTVRTVRMSGKKPVFTASQLHCAPSYQTMLSQYMPGASFVYTSATLTIGGSFSTFHNQLGLQNVNEAIYKSPFPLKKMTKVLIAKMLPDPIRERQAFLTQYAKLIHELITCNQGAALLLFASLDNLNEVYTRINAMNNQASDPLVLLKQGTAPARQLVRRFLDTDRTVLFGLKQFTEGLDISGAKLTLVAIDKIPFTPPDDPLHQGRARFLESRGENPFTTLYLAEAILSLRQAAGRLIRSEHDRGVIVLGDSRIESKYYGKRIKKEFSIFGQTNDIATLVKFLMKQSKKQPKKQLSKSKP